jgi:hypothetical protein
MTKVLITTLFTWVLFGCGENPEPNKNNIIDPFKEITVVKTKTDIQVDLIPNLIENIKLNKKFIPSDLLGVKYKDKHRFRKIIKTFEEFRITKVFITDQLRDNFPKGAINEYGEFYFKINKCPEIMPKNLSCDGDFIKVSIF